MRNSVPSIVVAGLTTFIVASVQADVSSPSNSRFFYRNPAGETESVSVTSKYCGRVSPGDGRIAGSVRLSQRRRYDLIAAEQLKAAIAQRPFDLHSAVDSRSGLKSTPAR